MNKNRIILRLISSPFIFGMLLVFHLFHFIKHFIGIIRYGGELITYQKDDPKKVDDIYRFIKDKYDNGK